MLSPEETEQIRARLEEAQRKIVENARGALGFSMSRDRDLVGRDSMDESVEEELFSTELRLHDREKFLFTKIQGALARLEAGEIDDCEECEEPIGFRRLMARPMTTLCIACKQMREEEESNARPVRDIEV
jgi:DnaK suppressor protein